MALVEKLKQIASGEQAPGANEAKNMDELFANSKEAILFERLSRSLKEVALGMKADMIREVGELVVGLVEEAVGKIDIPIPRDGRDGKDGLPGRDGDPGKDAEKVDLSADKIKGLPELIRKFTPRSRGGGGGGGSTLRVDNFSASANGSTTAFTATYRIGAAHALFYSGFPSVILPTTDYTVANRTVTLVAGVPIPQTGQSLLFIYEDAS